MPSAQATVGTDRAGRYLVQLCRHTSQMRRMSRLPFHHAAGHRGVVERQARPAVEHVEWSDTDGTVRFTEGRWTLHATPDTLTLRVDADDADALRRLQEAITARLERIGRRDNLIVTWHAPHDARPGQ